MVVYQIIKTDFSEDGNFLLHCRSDAYDKVIIEVYGFQSYFYTETSNHIPNDARIISIEQTTTKSIEENLLTKITTQHPSDVPRLKQTLPSTQEADIPFIRRMLIDQKIFGQFEILSNKTTVHYTDLIPHKGDLIGPLICYCDIETNSDIMPNPKNAEYPVCGLTVYDSYFKRYLEFYLDENEDYKKIRPTKPHNTEVFVFTKEDELLESLNTYLKQLKPDFITGWNFIRFDWEYLTNRMKQFDMELYDTGIQPFDLLDGYAKVYKRLGNRLKEVVLEEKLTDEVVASEYHNEFYTAQDKSKFLLYNKKDVEYCFLIDQKYQLIRYFFAIMNTCGLENIKYALSNMILIDTITLRISKDLGIALPTNDRNKKGRGLKGGSVFKAPKGFIEWLGIYDMSRYYAYIVIAFKISPDKDRVIMPAVNSFLIKNRDKYEKILDATPRDDPFYVVKEITKDAAKFILESSWGVMGSLEFRLFSLPDAQKVTREAREGLWFLRDSAKAKGYNVLYGDTDSIFIKHKTTDPSESDAIVIIINDALNAYADSKKIPRYLKVKLDELFDTSIFSGAKKRYAGHVCFAKGKPADYIKIRGYETRRRSTSQFIKELQKDILTKILKRESIPKINEYVINKFSNIRNLPLEKLAIRVQLSKPIDIKESLISKAYYYQASLYANKHLALNIRQGDQVKILPVKRIPTKPETKWLAYLDDRQIPKGTLINYKKIESDIWSSVDTFLDMIGIGRSHIRNTAKVSEVW